MVGDPPPNYPELGESRRVYKGLVRAYSQL
jgi:hypothetical protein